MLEKAKKPQMTRYNWNKLTEQKGFAWLNKEDCGIITSFPPPQKKKKQTARITDWLLFSMCGMWTLGLFRCQQNVCSCDGGVGRRDWPATNRHERTQVSSPAVLLFPSWSCVASILNQAKDYKANTWKRKGKGKATPVQFTHVLRTLAQNAHPNFSATKK